MQALHSTASRMAPSALRREPRRVAMAQPRSLTVAGVSSVTKSMGPLSSLDMVPLEERRQAASNALQWFRVPPKVYFKGGCLEVALRELEGRSRAFIVTDKNMFDLDYAEKITMLLDDVNVQHQIFYHVPSEPTQDTIEAAMREVRDFRPDVIIAVGGGAPMDAAKALWVLYELSNYSLAQMVEDAGAGRRRIGEASSLGSKALCICVPTTSGTGAEVTPFAVIRDVESGRKLTLADYAMTPSMAILDPQLVINLPRAQTAYGGQLTLAHAFESYISVFASDYSRGMSKHAMSMMSRYYERAYRRGSMDYHAREKMHNAATVAGMAFANTYLGICHALASEVSAVSGAHLGLVSGVLLPHVLAFQARDKVTKEAIADLAEHLHTGGTSVQERYSGIIDWLAKMRAAADIPSALPQALGDVGYATLQARLDAVCVGALDNAHGMASPVQPSIQDLKDILARASK